MKPVTEATPLVSKRSLVAASLQEVHFVNIGPVERKIDNEVGFVTGLRGVGLSCDC